MLKSLKVIKEAAINKIKKPAVHIKPVKPVKPVKPQTVKKPINPNSREATKGDISKSQRKLSDVPKTTSSHTTRPSGQFDIKKKINESGGEYSVHVRDYGPHMHSDDGDYSKSEMNHPHFDKALKAHGGEYNYSTDKGVGFKFKHKQHAENFRKEVNHKFKSIHAEHDDSSVNEMSGGAVGGGASMSIGNSSIAPLSGPQKSATDSASMSMTRRKLKSKMYRRPSPK
jgi:hypothetical protein